MSFCYGDSWKSMCLPISRPSFQVKREMTDMDIQGSLSVLQGIHEEQYANDDIFYHPYDHSTQSLYYQDPLSDESLRPMNTQLMFNELGYHPHPVYPSCSDQDDSHESDDSSVVLDQTDLDLIEMYEEGVEEKYSQSEAFEQYMYNNQCAQYQQMTKPAQPSQNNLPAFETLFKGNRHSNNLSRLNPNQPMTDSEDDEESNSICRKGKRGAKNVLLWKFLLEELQIGKHVEWTDIGQGTFRFVDTSEISRLWGKKKRKDDMNFEKLSRGIRHYYKSGFMSRQEGTRLIYRFNWSKVPKKYRQFDIKRGIAINHHRTY